MRLSSFILLFSPLIIFFLDWGGAWPGTIDPLATAVTMGGIGIILLMLTQRGPLSMFVLSVFTGIGLVAAQMYSIAYVVLDAATV